MGTSLFGLMVIDYWFTVYPARENAGAQLNGLKKGTGPSPLGNSFRNDLKKCSLFNIQFHMPSDERLRVQARQGASGKMAALRAMFC
jgi:hypothetical protein